MPSNGKIKGDSIKGLKLWRVDAYCGCGSAHAKGEKESLVYCGLSTVAAAILSVLYPFLCSSKARYPKCVDGDK